MGLTAEAIGALQTAADGFRKLDQKPAALELLRKMATLDPTNTSSPNHLRLTELGVV
jgi:hypothetical protein